MNQLLDEIDILFLNIDESTNFPSSLAPIERPLKPLEEIISNDE